MKTFNDIYSETNSVERATLGSPAAMAELVKGRYGEIILYHQTKRKVKKGYEKVATLQMNGSGAFLVLGGPGHEGFLTIKDEDGNDICTLNGGTGELNLGSKKKGGSIELFNKKGGKSVTVYADNGALTLGGNGTGGNLMLQTKTGLYPVSLSADKGNLTLGCDGVNGDISIKNNCDCETIAIDGARGDIYFRNCDVAEEFELQTDALKLDLPGTVMTLCKDGTIAPCARECDAGVVGVISGAGSYRPALVMDKNGLPNRVPIAVMGKVYCKADASRGGIRVGDLLTTAATRGHAMKVRNKTDAFGAIIGKALGNLRAGKGLVPVLVGLK